MYLVRSIALGELSPLDLRLSMLSHFDKPLVIEKEEADDLVERCESGFERDVFTALTSRGYRVTPQVKTGAYRIAQQACASNFAAMLQQNSLHRTISTLSYSRCRTDVKISHPHSVLPHSAVCTMCLTLISHARRWK